MVIKTNTRKSLTVPLNLDEKMKAESKRMGLTQNAFILMCVNNYFDNKTIRGSER